jgi:hypothetical protein
MAKEFLDWNNKFSKAQLAAKRKEFGVREADTDYWIGVGEYNGWGRQIQSWSAAEIRLAVYFEEDAAEWQCFRVALKGLSTQQKLHMLDVRYNQYVGFGSADVSDEKRRREHCRIDNYLGALVRGGQLTVEYKLQRN